MKISAKGEIAAKIDEEKMGFETLYVYVCKLNEFAKELKSEGFSDVKKFAQGHRGFVYTAEFENEKCKA